MRCQCDQGEISRAGLLVASTLDKPMLKVIQLLEVQLHLIGFTSESSHILVNIIRLKTEAEAKVLKNLKVSKVDLLILAVVIILNICGK